MRLLRELRRIVEHRMTTYAAALAYRGHFPFVLLVVALLGLLRFDGVLGRLVEQLTLEFPQPLPQPLEPTLEEGRPPLCCSARRSTPRSAAIPEARGP